MNIKKDKFTLWRENLSTYHVDDDGTLQQILIVKLYSIKNSVETLVKEYDMEDRDTITLDIVEEGIYKLYIENFVYTIKHFPTLKQTIIDLIKTNIHSCNDKDDSDCNSTEITTLSKAYGLRFALTTIDQYLNLLLSQDFIRDYRSCFDIVLQDDSITLLNLMQNESNNFLIQGQISNDTTLYKLTLVYFYFLLYVIELDTAEYAEESFHSTVSEITAVENLFNIQELYLYFDKLNIDYTTIITKLKNCYKLKTFGGDGLCKSIFKNIYYGKNTTGNLPTVTDIVNGTMKTIDTADSISLNPDTKSNEYLWIAVPVGFSSKRFFNWEAVGSTFNRSDIGITDDPNSNNEFILWSPNVIGVGGVEYYIYYYNWSSMFTGTLRLYTI